jgi:uncharacterized protein (DUF433 family)
MRTPYAEPARRVNEPPEEAASAIEILETTPYGKVGFVMSTAAKTVYSHITKDPDVCGGRACIDGTRIRVVDIACLQRGDYTPERMLEVYPSLNLAQIHAALSYYYENPPEIESALEEDRDIADKIERDRGDFLRKPPAG